MIKGCEVGGWYCDDWYILVMCLDFVYYWKGLICCSCIFCRCCRIDFWGLWKVFVVIFRVISYKFLRVLGVVVVKVCVYFVDWFDFILKWRGMCLSCWVCNEMINEWLVFDRIFYFLLFYFLFCCVLFCYFFFLFVLKFW